MKRLLKSNNKGLTLMEVLVTLVITSIVVVGIMTFVVNNVNYTNKAQDEIYIQDQVRTAMRFITKEALDKNKYDTIGALSAGIHMFYKDSDNWFCIQHNSEDKTIEHRKVSPFQVGEVFAENIVSFVVTKDASNEKLVEVTITGEKNDAEFELTSQIYLRN
ncbi:MAG: prepilin-type N-terminal cleavage/methylation domain-containing protein [Clostridia bacterium]|nr:prepilin-type N-terminal cleavage/methylation domain-containing protein [Clostridia bacterium]